MTDTHEQGLSTRSVHAGERRDPEGAIHTPLYTHSTPRRLLTLTRPGLAIARPTAMARSTSQPPGRKNPL
ncbi:hypothetical protein [Streptomyces sp. NPDC001070]